MGRGIGSYGRMSPRPHLFNRRFVLAGIALGALLTAVAIGRPDSEAAPEYVVERHVLTIAPELQPEYHDEGGSVSAAYKINNNIWSVADLPVEVRFNPDGAPLQHDPENMIRTGMDIWNGVAGSTFEFAWGGYSEAAATTCGNPFVMDGINTIKFVTSLPPGTLGITCTVWTPGKPNAPLLEFDMQLNANINWGSGPVIPAGQYDLFSTTLHELGHAAGLGHPCTLAGGCTVDEELSVMYPTLVSQMQKRQLRSDDIAAITAAYPQAQVTPATPSPSATPSPTPTPPPPTVTVPPGGSLFFSIRAPAIARD